MQTITAVPNIIHRITERTALVAVLGLGAVGLPVALAVQDAGLTVLGIDPEADRTADGLKNSHRSLNVTADIILICVPTPLKDGLPDLSFLESAVQDAARCTMEGALVVIESTVAPGTTRRMAEKYLPGRLVAHSPERIDPGASHEWTLIRTPKLVGGVTPDATEAAAHFYREAVCTTAVPCSSAEVAEAAKLFENTYRAVNIALAHEVRVALTDAGIPFREVFEAAATKPFGFQPFSPGAGVGGDCIPVSPNYLFRWSCESGKRSKLWMVNDALLTMRRMPEYVARRAVELAGGTQARFLVLGTGYKPESACTKNSPGLAVAQHLEAITGRPPAVCDRGNPDLSEVDCVVLCNAHGVDRLRLADEAKLVVDATGEMYAAGITAPHVHQV